MSDSFPADPGASGDSFPRQDLPGDDAAPTAEPLLFHRYKVERELGRGGMGVVLLAFDTKLGIHVAVKLVPDQLVPDTEAINDLRREVLRGMALMHPGIVRTHTFEQDETGAAIVMEYIHGWTLTELKEQQAGRCFEPEQLRPWLEPLCGVLDYAHREARIVHRDLKPRNIMLTQDGRLKVADFGIAATLTDTLSAKTGEGLSSGTPPYMSPQQAKGRKPSPLDDIYALGATLYELLTGKPPFFRGPPHVILTQVLEETPVSLAERREELEVRGREPIPAVWEEVIAACLAKDPAQRPQTAGEVLRRLTAPPSTPAAAVKVPATPKVEVVPKAARSSVLERLFGWLIVLGVCAVVVGGGYRYRERLLSRLPPLKNLPLPWADPTPTAEEKEEKVDDEEDKAEGPVRMATGYQTYEVVAGDHVSLIARKFGLTTKELLAANQDGPKPLRTGFRLKAGRILRIPLHAAAATPTPRPTPVPSPKASPTPTPPSPR